MIKNSSKILFMITLISGSLITISSNSWIGAWMGLEINLLSFIPLMIDKNNLMSTESALKYFLTQALASSMLLFAIIISMMNINFINQMNFYMNYYDMIIMSALILKLGAAPFHFWFPSVMEGLSWTNNLILMTWQKISPLMLLSYFMNQQFMLIFIILSIIIGSLGGLNQTSLRKIMAFSSINHLGWMLTALLSNDSLWLIYFMIYTILSFNLIIMFNLFKLSYINQIFSMFFNSNSMKFNFFMNLLSLGGLPPFMGFMPKLLIMQFLVLNNQYFLMTLLTSLTLITLFFYLRMCYSSFMLSNFENNWYNKNLLNNLYIKTYLISSMISLFGLPLISIMYLFI